MAEPSGTAAPVGPGRPTGPMTVVRRTLGAVTHAQSVVGEGLIAALAVFVSIEAILRWSINWSFLVTDEIGGYVMVIVAFFGMAVALHDRALFRVEVLFHKLSPNRQRQAQVVFDLVSLGFALLLAWQLVALVLRSFDKGIIAPTIMRTPLWIPQAGMALGAVVIVLVLVHQVIDGIRGLRSGMPQQQGD